MNRATRSILAIAVFLALGAAAAGARGGVAGAEPLAPRPTPTLDATGAPDTGLGASATAYANLVVQGIEVVPSNGLLVNRAATIRITVANIGSGSPTKDGLPAAFYLDLFVNPAVSTAEDLLSMPGYPSTLSLGMQATWLPPGHTYVVEFNHAFDTSGVYDLYAVVDIAELGLPYGNVNEGGGAGESDNAYGPTAVDVLEPNVIVAKNGSDYVRGPASGLAIVPVPTGAVDQSGGDTLTFGDSALSLGYFEEPPQQWGFADPITPDYEATALDRRLNDDNTTRPQQWARLAAVGDLGTDTQGQLIDDDDVCSDSSLDYPLLAATWEDRRNSDLTDWDVYLTWSTTQGDSYHANLRVNDDGSGNDQRHPAVAISPCNGRLLVVWQDNRVTAQTLAGRYAIWGQWYQLNAAAGLDKVGANFIVSTTSNADSLTPDVVAGPGNERDASTEKLLYYNFYVVWQSDGSSNSDVYLRGWSPATGWSSASRRISDDTEGANQRAPRVAAGRTEVLVDWRTVSCSAPYYVPVFDLLTAVVNPIVVTWEDDRNGDYDTYATFSIDDFQTFASDTRINDDTMGNGAAQRTPVVGVVQSWQFQTLSDKDGICPPPAEGDDVASASVQTPLAGFYFAWQDFRNSTDGILSNDPDIYYGHVSFDLASGSVDESMALDANEELSSDGNGTPWQESPALVTRSYSYTNPDSLEETYYGHTAFFVWADRRNPGAGSSDIYMAVRGDTDATLPPAWNDVVIQVNSGVHAVNLGDSAYLDYDEGDPPGAYQVRPSIAADLWAGPASERDDVHWHRGYVYVGWDDNRRGGYDRDVYVARSNMTYFANYAFYGLAPDQLQVGDYCKFGSGSYLSPIYDVGMSDVTWDRIEWNATTPSGTFVTLQTRVGNDPDNMGEWLPKTFPFAEVGLENLGAPLQGYDEPGQLIVGSDGLPRPQGRYVQYRVNMWAWPLYGPSANAWCGTLDENPRIVWAYPVVHTPTLYSVSLHYVGGMRNAMLPSVFRRYRP